MKTRLFLCIAFNFFCINSTVTLWNWNWSYERYPLKYSITVRCRIRKRLLNLFNVWWLRRILSQVEVRPSSNIKHQRWTYRLTYTTCNNNFPVNFNQWLFYTTPITNYRRIIQVVLQAMYSFDLITLANNTSGEIWSTSQNT